MNLFDKAKIKKNIKNCQYCGVSFVPDKRNVNRGWGLCCSKSCASLLKNRFKKMDKSELIKELRDMRLSQLGIDK